MKRILSVLAIAAATAAVAAVSDQPAKAKIDSAKLRNGPQTISIFLSPIAISTEVTSR